MVSNYVSLLRCPRSITQFCLMYVHVETDLVMCYMLYSFLQYIYRYYCKIPCECP